MKHSVHMKICVKLEVWTAYHSHLFSTLQGMIFGWKPTSACQGYCHMLDDTTLFSKLFLNKLWVNVKNKIMLMCAKFPVDLIKILKAAAGKQNGLIFWPTLFMYFFAHMYNFHIITVCT